MLFSEAEKPETADWEDNAEDIDEKSEEKVTEDKSPDQAAKPEVKASGDIHINVCKSFLKVCSMLQT